MSKKERGDNPPYEELIKNHMVVENLKKGLCLSGIPLELRVRKILSEHGYRGTTYRYFFPQGDTTRSSVMYGPGIWRELDIKACRNVAEIEVGGSKVAFVVNILAECKYSSQKDFFIFEHTDPDNLAKDHFPMRLNGDKLFLHPYGLDFNFDLTGRQIDRVCEVDVSAPFSKEEENYNDRTTREACKQMINALLYFYDRQKEHIRSDYTRSRHASFLWKAYQEKLARNKVERETKPDGSSVVREDFIRDFVAKNVEKEYSFDHVFPYTRIEFIFPIIVINSERGFINAKLNDKFEIIGFDTDKKFYLYFYTDEEQERYDRILKGHYTLPVILVNLKDLPYLIKFIEDGVKKIAETTLQDLKKNPYKLAHEVLFGGEEPFYFSIPTMLEKAF